MIPNDIKDITEVDLQSLIDDAVSEKKNIDYKQSLDVASDAEKKEFLADVSSFANASGGDLIIGISENDGIPEKILGIEIDNLDEILLKLDNIIRDGINPRLPAVNIQPVKLKNSKFVLVIRITQSWLSPHRVIYKGHDKFYSRSTNGKYPLDVSELRTAFTLSEMLTTRIKNFRDGRISKIYADEMPVPFEGNSKVVLHLIPFIAFRSNLKIKMEDINAQHSILCPMFSRGWNSRYNLEGVLTYTGRAEIKSHSYVNFYTSGIVEAVEGSMLSGRKEISNPGFEEEILASLKQYLLVMRSLNVQLPLVLFLTLLNVKNHRMFTAWTFPGDEPSAIGRDVLLLPEVIIENYETECGDILKPCFDALWNACGFRGSPNYDKDGKWHKQ